MVCSSSYIIDTQKFVTVRIVLVLISMVCLDTLGLFYILSFLAHSFQWKLQICRISLGRIDVLLV